MESVNHKYLNKHKRFRMDSKTMALASVVLALLVAAIVFWCLKLVGITIAGDAFCGLQEHTHTEACYTDDPPCEKKEHVHTADCFPDQSADVETVSDWLQTIEKVEITNSVPDNLIGIASSQLGYEESQRNFTYDSNGNKQGYTRYGEWYGNPYGQWDATFVSFCLHYANANNADTLKGGGAESLRLAWKNRALYASATDYTPQRGDLVFFDHNRDGTADTVAILLSPDPQRMTVIAGDSNNKVEILHLDSADAVTGYGRTGELSYARDTTYQPGALPAEKNTLNMQQSLALFAAPRANITYTSHLEDEIVNAIFRRQDGTPLVGENAFIHIGESYQVEIEFSEINVGNQWIQFEHNEEGYLTYHLPDNLQCDPFDSRPITAKTEAGTVENVGYYSLDENGLLRVHFYNVDGVSFVDKYSNVDFTIDFNATVTHTQSGTTTEIQFNDQIRLELGVDGGAEMKATKTHNSEYNSIDHTIEYTIEITGTHGVVHDLVVDDEIWENHRVLRDTIVVTDKDGNLLDPQPTISDHPQHNSGASGGFSLSGFPDLHAGETFYITYKSQIYEDLLNKESVDMWNMAYIHGTDSDGVPVELWPQDWLAVKPERLKKEGRQAAFEDENGNVIPVIEWVVHIKKNNTDMEGILVIDTLGEGLEYFTAKDILIQHYDEWGNPLHDVHLSWDEVTITDSSLSFPLPEGYSFDITYYTTYTELDEDESETFTNQVTTTINGTEQTVGGNADVVGFTPHVSKTAHGTDGENVYFTITADVPAVIKGWGNFYLTDMAAFWNYFGQDQHLYAENIPRNLVVTATTASGKTITFTPHEPGGPEENTYMLVYPSEGEQYHSFKLYFNTATATQEASKWMLEEASTLTITYQLPFDTPTGTAWEGVADSDLTLGDALLSEHTLYNEVFFNYAQNVHTQDSASYEYAPMLIKDSVDHKNGTIDYTVLFQNSVPGSWGNSSYLNYQTTSAYFNDTFDQRLEYVPGTLTVTCYDPWRPDMWLNKYTYTGDITGNVIRLHANQFTYVETNPAAADVGWSGLNYLPTLESYYKWMNGGGVYEFTYTLRIKDEYLYTTDYSKLELDNVAEITWNDTQTSGPATEHVEFETGLLDKQMAQTDNRLDFSIYINNYSLDILEGSDTLTVRDVMTDNLSVYWDTIQLYYDDGQGHWVSFSSPDCPYQYTVTYDQYTNTLVFTVPDELHVKIDYSTLVTEHGYVSVNNVAAIEGKAHVSDFSDAIFRVEEHSGEASGSVHSITLLKHDGDTLLPLPNVTLHLYGPMGDPKATVPDGLPSRIEYDAETTLYYIGAYTTGEDGTTPITTQYLTEGGPYALVEAQPPDGYMALTDPVYFYFYKDDPNGVIQTVTTLVTVENFKYGFVLPETGGDGRILFGIIGIAVMAIPIVYSRNRRKRERRLT